MYVVEGCGYPFLPAKGKPGQVPPKLGRIALLEDKNSDGRFEKRTTFAEGFTFPNGILPWKGGVFVTCAPDIWYLKDTTGDGKADVRRIVLTGFGTKSSSEQLRVASPTLGPDGWVYVTSGLTDAKVTSPMHPDRPTVTTKRQDGRFHPDTFAYEALAGTGQFGQCFDAKGNRFVSSNRNPLMHVVLTPSLLRRNPHYPFADSIHQVVPVAGKVYPLSPDTTAASYIPSLISRQHAGTYTSASGICIRGDSAFICEPAQNLVQRQVLTSTGATFTAAHPTPGRDFIATPDQWFRPVHASVGPDGALYICDMVRQYIDHPRYLPEDIRSKLPFKAGNKHGRIWRVRLKTPLPPSPTPAQKSAARHNLQVRQGKFPQAPVKELLKQAKSKDANDRFLAVLQLGGKSHPDKTTTLVEALTLSARNKWMRGAVFNAIETKQLHSMWVALGQVVPKPKTKDRPNFNPVMESMGLVAAAVCNPDELVKLLAHGSPLMAQSDPKAHSNFSLWDRIAFLNGLAEGARKRGLKMEKLLPPKPKLTAEETKALFKVGAKLPAPFVAYADLEAQMKLALTSLRSSAPEVHQINAIKLLGHSDFAFAGETLMRLVVPDGTLDSPSFSSLVQSEAVRALGNLNDKRVGPKLLKAKAWIGFNPSTRESVLAVVTGRSTYHPSLRDALEKGIVQVHALSPARRKALERSKSIGERAKKLFAQHTGGDRMKTYKAARPILKLKPDPANGSQVFTRVCANCHTHGNQGHAVGPDLTGLRNQPAETLLLHIIVPNHEVYGGYTMYEVDTKDDQTFAGLLGVNTPGHITLKLPLGLTKTIARKNIKTLRASPNSLMPDQLEKAMTKQELADLIAFLKK